MTGYATRELTVDLCGRVFRVRALRDRQQFDDPEGVAELAGISSATWCLFGQIWPAGLALAQAMSTHDVEGKRVLELGCGLGLSSLVLRHRLADITASDHHPLADEFLQYNAQQNQLPPISFRDLRWERPDATLGRFDLIIGGDILYERDHAELLAAVVERHALPAAEVVITDPGRGHAARLSRALVTQGFAVSERRHDFSTPEMPYPRNGRMLTFRRGLPV